MTLQQMTDKIDLEVILLDMDKFSIQNMNLHTRVWLRHVTSSF